MYVLYELWTTPLISPARPRCSSADDIALKPVSSPGVVRHSSAAPDRPTPPAQQPPSDDRPLVPLEGPLVPLDEPLVPLDGPLVPPDGPLVPLDGPRSGSGQAVPLVEEGEAEAAALAVVVSSYQFSQPDLR